jgi:hypothetical protein
MFCDLSLGFRFYGMMKSLIIVSLLVVVSCSDPKALEPAIGFPGRINIIINPAQWSGPIGKTLDSLFTQEMTVLPRPEPIFKIRQVNPDAVNSSMKRTRNLIFVFALDDNSVQAETLRQMVTPSTLDAIRKDTSLFMSPMPDVYARGQEVLYLFSADTKTLHAKIRKNGQRILNHFNNKERARLEKGILNATTTKALSDQIAREHGFRIKIPFGYKLADNQKDFVWLRQINPADDKDVFIASKKYTSPADFKKENLIKFRNEICQKYLFEDPEQPDTYILTETSVPDKEVELRDFNWAGKYAAEVRGLWKTNGNMMGGPFLAYALVDEKKGILYYIEGFTYSPSKDQREIMRELETILLSFQVVNAKP